MQIKSTKLSANLAKYTWVLPSWIAVPCMLVAAVFLALTTYLQPGSEIVPGLDSSWAYGLSYVYEKGLVLGQDIYFTFGPLGFLLYANPLSLKIIGISSFFWFLVSVLQCLIIFDYLYRYSRTQTALCAALNLAAALTMIFVANAHGHDSRLLLLGYILVFLHNKTALFRYIVLQGIISAICIAIKFSYGAVALSLFIPYLTMSAWKKRSPKLLVAGILSFLLAYLAIWILMYGGITGVVGYIKGGLAFSQGSTSAMATNPQNVWSAIAWFYIAFAAMLWLASYKKSNSSHLLPYCFLGPMFIWSKYAFGLEDTEHLSFLMPYVFYVAIVLFIAVENIKIKAALPFFAVISFAAWIEMHANVGSPQYSAEIVYFKPDTFMSRLKIQNLVKIWNKKTEDALMPLRLPSDIRELIGNNTVDIYPWESVIAEANHLNWTPRPIFQNYITYTPFLDGKNREFLEGSRAPKYIVWHFHSYQDIGSRYAMNTDPLTNDAIFRHYRLEKCEGNYCLFMRQIKDQLTPSTVLGANSAGWDKWVSLPDFSEDILRASVHVERSILGKVNLALWKEGGVYIDYRLRDGTVKTHEIVVDNAESGIWASPYFEHFSEHVSRAKLISGRELSEMLAYPHAEGYIENIKEGMSGPAISGWGFLPFKDTSQQHIKVLLFNDENAYEAKLENQLRPGIAENYPDNAATNLEYTGFNNEIIAKDMVPGKYSVRFVVENEREKSVSDNQNLKIEVMPTLTSGNVKAMRLRSIRSWAFKPDILVEWSASSFTEKNALR